MSKGPFTVFYHTGCAVFWGRAFAPVAVLRHASADFSIKQMPEAPAGAGFAVPMVTFPEGYTISQTPVVTHALGKRFGLIGSGDADEFVANQLLADGADFLGEVFGGKPADRVNKWIGYFEGKLGGKDFFLGSSPSAVDFSIFSVFHLIKEKVRVGNPAVEGYAIPASLESWIARVQGLPTISAMLAEHPIMPEGKL